MYNSEDRFCEFKDLTQGNKFNYKNEKYMVLPKDVTCYGEKSNAINLDTGTIVFFKLDTYIDLDTMNMLDEKDVLK